MQIVVSSLHEMDQNWPLDFESIPTTADLALVSDALFHWVSVSAFLEANTN